MAGEVRGSWRTRRWSWGQVRGRCLAAAMAAKLVARGPRGRETRKWKVNEQLHEAEMKDEFRRDAESYGQG